MHSPQALLPHPHSFAQRSARQRARVPPPPPPGWPAPAHAPTSLQPPPRRPLAASKSDGRRPAQTHAEAALALGMPAQANSHALIRCQCSSVSNIRHRHTPALALEMPAQANSYAPIRRRCSIVSIIIYMACAGDSHAPVRNECSGIYQRKGEESREGHKQYRGCTHTHTQTQNKTFFNSFSSFRPAACRNIISK